MGCAAHHQTKHQRHRHEVVVIMATMVAEAIMVVSGKDTTA